MEAYVREALEEASRLAGDRLPGDDDRLRLRLAGDEPADFRRLTQLVLATALDHAGTWVCEPLADLALEMPASTAQGVLAALGRLGGRVTGQFSANGVSKRAPCCRRAGALAPAPAARAVDGRGDPGDAAGRLPADRRRTHPGASARDRARSTAMPGSRRGQAWVGRRGDELPHAAIVHTPGSHGGDPVYVKDPRVDAYIDALPDWQQAICRQVRDLVHAADPEVVETIKRTVQPYFVLDGNVVALLAAKDHVTVFLYDGGLAPDPTDHHGGHGNETGRMIAIREGEPINAPAMTAIFRAIIAGQPRGRLAES
jgi:hypothetical protein